MFIPRVHQRSNADTLGLCKSAQMGHNMDKRKAQRNVVWTMLKCKLSALHNPNMQELSSDQ